MSAFGHEGNPPEDWKASVHAAALLKRGDTSAPTCSTCHGSHGAAPPGVTSVALVCAQCHVREAELFRKSPKKAIFDLIGQGECLTCHSNHRIQKPADSFIGLQEPALCATCHNNEMNGAAVITAMQKGLSDLDTGIVRANAVLDRAASAGMLVDDGRLALRDAHEDQILARVSIHAFADKPFAATAGKGIAEAARAEAIGTAAMGELRYRRNGLAVATLLIVGFLATLWIKIRRLPSTGDMRSSVRSTSRWHRTCSPGSRPRSNCRNLVYDGRLGAGFSQGSGKEFAGFTSAGNPGNGRRRRQFGAARCGRRGEER